MFSNIFKIKNFFKGAFTNAHGSVEFEVQNTDFGKIFCETSLIERLAEMTARKVKGVHDVSVIADKPISNFNPLKVRYNVVLKQGFSANDVSAEISDALKKILVEMIGIIDVTIDIKVTGVEQVEIKRRVK